LATAGDGDGGRGERGSRVDRSLPHRMRGKTEKPGLKAAQAQVADGQKALGIGVSSHRPQRTKKKD